MARTAILRLGKRPRSTEEMMEAIECLRTTRAEEQVLTFCVCVCLCVFVPACWCLHGLRSSRAVVSAARS